MTTALTSPSDKPQADSGIHDWNAIQKDNKKTHFVLGFDKDFNHRKFDDVSEEFQGYKNNFNKHIQMANESKKTHFKMSIRKDRESRLNTTQRLAYQNKDSEIVQPTIDSLEFKKTHFNLGYQKIKYESTNHNSFDHGICLLIIS